MQHSNPSLLRGERPHYGHLFAALIAIAVVAVLNPVGYIGGGQDDARYLEAARCWAEQGVCLPTNHWEGRWPVFAPIAWITSLLGESRWTVQLWPFLSSALSALLVAEVSRRVFGNLAAIFNSILFVSLPTFALQLMKPSVEAIELAFILGAVLCMLNWHRTDRATWSFAAGLCFGLAVQVRETSVAAAAVALIALYVTGKRPRLDDLAWAAAGFGLPLAVEFLAYQWAAGDPLFRRNLSMAHTSIHSSQLDPSVDTSGWPILNPDIIGGWKREPDIDLHWLVDGPLSLLMNATAGFSLLLTPLLLMVGKNHLSSADRRTAWLLLGFAWAYVAIVTYVLAMDPKPRVMLVALAASSTAMGLVSARLRTSGRRLLVGACVGAALAGSAILVAGFWRPSWAEQQAKIWSAKYPDSIETDAMTKPYLTLAPELGSLPGYGAGRPFAMSVSEGTCPTWLERSGLGTDLALVDQKRLSLFPQFGRSGRWWICLFHYERPVSPKRMEEGAQRTWLKS